MKQISNTVLCVKKPLQPHRIIKNEEIPTKDEIQKKYARIEKLNKLGISNTTLDMDRDNDNDYEEDLDKLEASILIMQDKEVPKELEQRILENNSMAKSSQ
jgi:hypothetical protein